MVETPPRRGGLRSPAANSARAAEADRTAEVGIGQMEAAAASAAEDATFAEGQAAARPSAGRVARAEAARATATDRAAAVPEARAGLDELRASRSQPALRAAAAGPAAPATPVRGGSTASTASRARSAPATRRAAESVTADQLNAISLDLARNGPGQRDVAGVPAGPGQTVARQRISQAMGFAKGGLVQQTPGWSFGAKSCGNGTTRYAKRK